MTTPASSWRYYENKIYENDPFARLDQEGVGQLVKIAAEKGRATRPDIVLGICGEHGGDPSSIEFCHNVGLNYVSCSPFPCSDRPSGCCSGCDQEPPQVRAEGNTKQYAA